jgi:hypothetical protein
LFPSSASSSSSSCVGLDHGSGGLELQQLSGGESAIASALLLHLLLSLREPVHDILVGRSAAATFLLSGPRGRTRRRGREGHPCRFGQRGEVDRERKLAPIVVVFFLVFVVLVVVVIFDFVPLFPLVVIVVQLFPPMSGRGEPFVLLLAVRVAAAKGAEERCVGGCGCGDSFGQRGGPKQAVLLGADVVLKGGTPGRVVQRVGGCSAELSVLR